MNNANICHTVNVVRYIENYHNINYIPCYFQKIVGLAFLSESYFFQGLLRDLFSQIQSSPTSQSDIKFQYFFLSLDTHV